MVSTDKTLFCVVFSYCIEQTANKSLKKEALDLGKHSGALPCSTLQVPCLAGDQLSCPEPVFSSDPLTKGQAGFQCTSTHVLEYA